MQHSAWQAKTDHLTIHSQAHLLFVLDRSRGLPSHPGGTAALRKCPAYGAIRLLNVRNLL